MFSHPTEHTTVELVNYTDKPVAYVSSSKLKASVVDQFGEGDFALTAGCLLGLLVR